MRHNRKRNKLSRPSKARNALVRNLATSLVLHDKITTTAAKAKVLKPVMEKLVMIIKKDDNVTAIRKLNAYFYDQEATRKMVEVLKPRFEKRNSGFISLRKRLPRPSDASPQIEISLVS